MQNAAPYLFSVLGAAALWMMLPRGAGATRPGAWPLLLGVAAVVGLVAVVGTGFKFLGSSAGELLFCLFGCSAVFSSVMLVTQERPVYAALWFVMTIIAVAGLLLLLGAQFTAAVLVIVYAGAILVTYLFVIMLAVKAGMPEYDTVAHRPLGACAAGFLLLTAFWLSQPEKSYPFLPPAPSGKASTEVAAASDPKPPAKSAASAAKPAPAPAPKPEAKPDTGKSGTEASDAGAPTVVVVPLSPAAAAIRSEYVDNHVRSLGVRIFTHHYVALQAAAVLLLVSLAGAVVIAQRKLNAAADRTETSAHDEPAA